MWNTIATNRFIGWYTTIMQHGTDKQKKWANVLLLMSGNSNIQPISLLAEMYELYIFAGRDVHPN